MFEIRIRLVLDGSDRSPTILPRYVSRAFAVDDYLYEIMIVNQVDREIPAHVVEKFFGSFELLSKPAGNE